MKNNATIITKTEFLKISYRALSGKVAPRGFSSLTFRLSGEVSIFTTDVSFVSAPNSLTFIPAGCGYETTVHKTGEMFIMHFETADGCQNFGHKPMTVQPSHADNFTNLYSRAIRHFQSGDRYFDCMADAYRLLSEAQREFFATAPHPYKKMKDVKKYIDENLCDPTLRVSALAEIFGTSEVYFRREFNKYYGATPVEYIKKQRIEHACRLLRTQLYTIAEVATRSGFDSISYFSSEFHKAMGCSPREYGAL